MQVDFYHLTAAPIERVLPRIAERVLADGGRLLIVADQARLPALDKLLWTWRADSFLPHACAGGERDANQPILLAADVISPNDARNVAIADGEWRDEVLGFDRAFHFFDEERIVEARQAWKALGDRYGVERRYWKQSEGGGWEQLA
ncbi:DNA polymerase III subunit chi [Hephaestia mangrovi]|uniref:DNA polymerase III subunit chi n=1 Tax=Hephaestia mangrovi TaxID=2873268 RepID=UPI001CA7AC9D|nr:DNA polymerase III subunit chi [Hephaestia mangrovi]MBY8827863.1 DNA polymerase III subunit chi [Hephaestia mangrovi]